MPPMPIPFLHETLRCACAEPVASQTAEGRKAPQIDEDRAAAFRSMLAYSGKYRTEGNRIIINVDIAWDESWNGTEQVRYYRIQGDQLHIEAAPQPYAN